MPVELPLAAEPVSEMAPVIEPEVLQDGLLERTSLACETFVIEGCIERREGLPDADIGIGHASGLESLVSNVGDEALVDEAEMVLPGEEPSGGREHARGVVLQPCRVAALRRIV